MPNPTPFGLAELIDFEMQLARVPPELQPRLNKTPSISTRASVFRHWLDEMRQLRPGPWPGEGWARLTQAAGTLAFALGSLSGYALIRGLLTYEAQLPVNILPFILIFAVMPLFLLLLLLFKTTVLKLLRRTQGGLLLIALHDLGLRALRKRSLSLGSLEAQQQFVNRLEQLHRPLFLQYAWRLLQIFATAAYLVAFVSFTLFLASHDYAFSWRSTLEWDAQTLHRILEILGLPFAWLSLTPSVALVEASQFNRFTGGYSGTAEAAAFSRGWWPYLSALILVYGCLPRLLLWIGASRAIRKYWTGLKFDDYASQTLWQRLGIEGFSPDGNLEAQPALPEGDLASRPAGGKAVLLVWRDLPLSLDSLKTFFQERYAYEVLRSLEAQGLSGETQSLIAALRETKAKLVLLATDSFELPGEAIDRMRKELRAALGSEILLLFVPLTQAEEGGIQLAPPSEAWRHAVQALNDLRAGLLQGDER